MAEIPPETKLHLAIIGCGAAAKVNHLPIAAGSERVKVAVLVDKVLSRARQFAEQYDVPSVTDDYRDIIGRVEAAVVALPNYLHAPVAIDLLRHGIHVLVEKPMALSTAECDAMIDASHSSGATLAVGLQCRFFSDSHFLKQFFAAGLLGHITGFDIRFGVIFRWPLQSDYLFQRDKAGGGVLIDLGIHMLDLLLWWFGPYGGVMYSDDSVGGVESNCEIRLELANGAAGVIELSRTRNLRNTCIVTGERGELEIEVWTDNPAICLRLNHAEMVLSGRVLHESGILTIEQALRAEIDDFVEAVQTGREPCVTGSEARKVIELIEACYKNRLSVPEPWTGWVCA